MTQLMIQWINHFVKNFFGVMSMEHKNTYYNRHDETQPMETIMPRRKTQLTEYGKSFGKRLNKLRIAAGYSQRGFAAEVGISQRMVVYYERECERVPIYLLPMFTKALGVSADELLGLKQVKENGRVQDNRLWHRFKQVEKLPLAQRRPIIQLIDAFLVKDKIKQAG